MFRSIIASLRIPHCIKNLFIFAGIIFSKHLFILPDITKICTAFVLFSLLSSAGYIINDIVDLSEDKKHPFKSKRPITSGKLSLTAAIYTSIILALIAIICGLWLNKAFGIILIIYLGLELIYSFLLKHKVILDVFGITGGFILRVIAGCVVIQVEISSWLLICTGLIALFLGFNKRRHELVLLGDEAYKHRRVLTEYSPYFLDQMISVVTASTVIVYILYTLSAETINRFGTDKLIFTIPFVLYGVFRYLYLVHQKEKGGSPTRLLLTDLPLLINVALWVLTSIIIIYYN